MHTARDMKPLINPRYAFAAEVDGRTVGFMLAVPDYSGVLQRIGNGRLFPTGALRLLLGKRAIRDWRVMALGLRRDFRARGILPLFAWEAFRRGREAGERSAEASWILEDNEPMNRAMAAMETPNLTAGGGCTTVRSAPRDPRPPSRLSDGGPLGLVRRNRVCT